MSNVSLTFANEFEKLPLPVSAFTTEPGEEDFSENYQVSQNLRKLVQQKYLSLR